MYPVDFPAVDDADLTSATEQYLSSLRTRSPKNEVAITANNVRRLQLFEDDQPDCTLLALHSPDEPTRVVALYLHEEWWCVDDVLRTSSKSRNGLLSVQSIVERVIVLLLSQVVERSSEEEALFSLHSRTESCKLLWRDSQAVGFYTVKPRGRRRKTKVMRMRMREGLLSFLKVTSDSPYADHLLIRRDCTPQAAKSTVVFRTTKGHNHTVKP